ncbi:MAG: BspA family leucine-rich repeat surface protein [Lachnospiraceae bacterium]|nr:BspA family leucine-rich repeat surface protein [Lachnospiraceae bacterium]
MRYWKSRFSLILAISLVLAGPGQALAAGSFGSARQTISDDNTEKIKEAAGDDSQADAGNNGADSGNSGDTAKDTDKSGNSGDRAKDADKSGNAGDTAKDTDKSGNADDTAKDTDKSGNSGDTIGNADKSGDAGDRAKDADDSKGLELAGEDGDKSDTSNSMAVMPVGTDDDTENARELGETISPNDPEEDSTPVSENVVPGDDVRETPTVSNTQISTPSLKTVLLGEIGGHDVKVEMTESLVYDGRKQMQADDCSRKNVKPSKGKAASVKAYFYVDGVRVNKDYLAWKFKKNLKAGEAIVSVAVRKEAYGVDFTKAMRRFFKLYPKALTFTIKPLEISLSSNKVNLVLNKAKIFQNDDSTLKNIKYFRYKFHYDELPAKKADKIVTLRFNSGYKKNKDFKGAVSGNYIILTGENNFSGNITAGVDELALKKYKGNRNNVTIPSQAVKEKHVYDVILEGNHSPEDTTFASTVSSISIMNGVRANSDISYLFSGCKVVKTLDLSPLDMSEVENASYLFNGCSNLNQIELGEFGVKDNAKLTKMFEGCTKLRTVKFSGKKKRWKSLAGTWDETGLSEYARIRCSDGILTRDNWND